LKSGAQLLQLGDGLRARGQTNQTKRELITCSRPVGRIMHWQQKRRRECGDTRAIHVCVTAQGAIIRKLAALALGPWSADQHALACQLHNKLRGRQVPGRGGGVNGGRTG
jgi:hypothetical protein